MKNEKGFTLVELLIAMVLALVVIVALSSTFTFHRKIYNLEEQKVEMIQNVRASLDMLIRETRMAGYDFMNIGIIGIPYNASQLEIRMDLNEDGDISDANEIVIYSEDSINKQIIRKTSNGQQTFAENIDSFSFQYFDKNRNTTIVSDDIRSIEITITARTTKSDPNYSHPVFSDGYRRYTLTSLVTPRNIGL